MMTYTQLIEKYKKPLEVAYALGIVTKESTYKEKCNASSRVCMWRKQSISKKWLDKLSELDKV